VRATLRLTVTLAALTALMLPAGAAARARFDTELLARIPTPGYPALGYVHPDGRIYEGTYENSNAPDSPSRVFEFTSRGELLRSWTVPGQALGGEQGVQVTTSDAQGNLVLLDRRPGRALKLDRRTGDFSTYATFADLKPCPPGQAATTCSPTLSDDPATPNYGAWGPDGSLYVTDYLQGVIWRVPPGGGAATVWLSDRRLDGGMFGTTGLMLGADRKTLYVAQGSSAGLGGLDPATGKLFAVAIAAGGGPGPLRQLWESQPGDLPDGFAIAASGRFYVPLVGLPQQIAVLAPDGRELERFPRSAGSGDNGSPVPFDSPSSARFLGTRLIVANQSAVAGDVTHQALLDVEAGETGLPELIPGRDGTAPALSRVAVSPKRFAAVRRGGKRHRARKGHPARGARLKLRLSERATVSVRVEQRRGRRWRRVQTIEKALAAGRRAIGFNARLRAGKKTRPFTRGRYRFSLQAADAAGNRSPRVFRAFRVVRGR
jgi:sugar lactone lactonase YvrE